MLEGLGLGAKRKRHFYFIVSGTVSLFIPFAVKHMSDWRGSSLPVPPRLCLLEDRSKVCNISKEELSVFMVRVITAARTVLRYWKSTKPPEMREGISYMIKSASHESMLTRRTKGDQN